MNTIQTKSFNLAIYDKGDKNSPKLALVLPGRLDTKDYAHMRSMVEYLGANGYYAVSFDPPGTWDSPGGIEIYSTSNYIKAVNEVIEYYGNKPTVLFGHSRGGAVAILAGTPNQYVTNIIVVMASYGQATPPDQNLVESGALQELRDIPPGTSRTTQQKQFLLPVGYFYDAVQYNAGDMLKKCTKPKLMFYGDADEFATPQRVKEVYSQTPDPKMLHELHSAHDYRLFPDAMEEVKQVVSDFIEKYG